MHYMNPFFEVTMKLVGLDPDNDQDFETARDNIEDLIYDKYEIDTDMLENLLKDLVKLTPIVRTELTETPVQGFVDVDKKMFLYKEECKNN